MACYELPTGLIPFEGHRLSDYKLVLSGGRPELPDYLSPEIMQLCTTVGTQILANGLAGVRSLKSYMQN
jgi:hypothetical protein